MKAYLWTTATLFALVAVAHVVRLVLEWRRGDPWFLGSVLGLGLVSGALAVWAFRLLRAGAAGGMPPHAGS